MGWDVALQKVECLVGHAFRDRTFLQDALTHSSYSNERQGEGEAVADNERLEFLGDAVIGLVVAELLMQAYPAACEGNLSRWRSALVSRRALAEVATELKLGDYMRFGIGESRTGGAEKRSILAGVLEAVVGALYRDAGLELCRSFLERLFSPWVQRIGKETVVTVQDNKTQLQEVVYLYFRQVPAYRLVESWGPEHSKSFKVAVAIDGLGEHFGVGKSKKEAEQIAAGLALENAQLRFSEPPGQASTEFLDL
jgi:ribonuclease III